LDAQEQKKKSAREEVRMQQKGVFRTVMYPKYMLCERLGVYHEYDAPPESLYLPLGYDKPETREVLAGINTNTADPEALLKFEKHYRRIYKDELENDKEIFVRDAFMKYDVFRGAPKPKKGLFASMFSAGPPQSKQIGMDLKPVGYFKGRMDIYDKKEMFQYNSQR
jgi:hypothetical protein